MEGIGYFFPVKGKCPKHLSQLPFSQDTKDSGGVLTTQVFFFFLKLCSCNRMFFLIPFQSHFLLRGWSFVGFPALRETHCRPKWLIRAALPWWRSLLSKDIGLQTPDLPPHSLALPGVIDYMVSGKVFPSMCLVFPLSVIRFLKCLFTHN